jgi:hypothetical protein
MASFDLHLSPGSPAINAGYNLNSFFLYDKDGLTRGETWDIGAYKYQPTIFVKLVPRIIHGMVIMVTTFLLAAFLAFLMTYMQQRGFADIRRISSYVFAKVRVRRKKVKDMDVIRRMIEAHQRELVETKQRDK